MSLTEAIISAGIGGFAYGFIAGADAEDKHHLNQLNTNCVFHDSHLNKDVTLYSLWP